MPTPPSGPENAAADDDRAHLRATVRRLRRREIVLRHRLAVAEWRLEVQLGRRSVRVVEAIGAARRSLSALLRLPVTVLRILSRPGARPPRPTEDAAIAAARDADTPTPSPTTPEAPAAPAALRTPLRRGLTPPELPGSTFPDGPVARPDLRIACILDEFSYRAFAYEAELTQLWPDRWETQLDEVEPHVVLVESAWRGEDDRWRHHMTGDAPSDDLVALVAACRARGIPAVFWNKEDPPNYDVFIATAALFDRVFTVDAGSLSRYAGDLPGVRVGVLPFAAQPRIHHPVLPAEGRDQSVMFAGTFHVDKHPHRKVQVAQVLDPARAFDLHIYARFTAWAYRWPPPLDAHVVGSLTYAQTLDAYRRYRVVLNVNSVPRSATMCARRIFELLACGTTVLSGTSPAIEALLGPGLVRQSADPDDTVVQLAELLGEDDDARARTAARGLRTVLGAHTYGHRLDRILEAAGIDGFHRPVPTVAAVVPLSGDGAALVADLAAQDHPVDHLVLVGPAEALRDAASAAGAAGLPTPVEHVTSTVPSRGEVLEVAQTADGDLVALLDASCRYGPGFLADQVNAFAYADVDAAVKAAHHVTDGTVVAVADRDAEHRHVSHASPGWSSSDAACSRTWTPTTRTGCSPPSEPTASSRPAGSTSSAGSIDLPTDTVVVGAFDAFAAAAFAGDA